MRKLIMDWNPGSIDSIAQEAIRISQASAYNVEFTFSGVTVAVDADCDVYAVSKKVLECVRNESKNVDFTGGRISVY